MPSSSRCQTSDKRRTRIPKPEPEPGGLELIESADELDAGYPADSHDDPDSDPLAPEDRDEADLVGSPEATPHRSSGVPKARLPSWKEISAWVMCPDLVYEAAPKHYDIVRAALNKSGYLPS